MTDTPAQPLVWVLEGIKAGDNTQMSAVAEALGWPRATKRIRYRWWELLTNLALRVTLAGTDAQSRAQLTPPWPDLVLSAGRRNEPVARWIQKVADKEVKLVHLGRPWASAVRFDLVVSTPQYPLAAAGNVMVNDLPLHRIDEAGLTRAASAWAERLSELPRPYVVLLAGGNSGAYVFTREKAQYLGHAVARQARDLGGSVLVTTSARTPGAAVAALRSVIDVPSFFFDWNEDRRTDGRRQDNPYLGYLALGDHFVVTGESMSMLAEACATGKPVQVFDLGVPTPGEPGRWWLDAASYGWRPLTHRLAQWLGPARMRRDVGRIQKRLVETGRATMLGDSTRSRGEPAPNRDLERTVERIKRLF
ncbi:MAG: ELM1/GtrOC1 family putative glycosyltransferase [Gammaproteobacteria bacterium]|nr:ELM1/GtrOC1 family putative glycosyltransferase [Gammaproteobacteria bacterium]